MTIKRLYKPEGAAMEGLVELLYTLLIEVPADPVQIGDSGLARACEPEAEQKDPVLVTAPEMTCVRTELE
jgi:hypothetical protein